MAHHIPFHFSRVITNRAKNVSLINVRSGEAVDIAGGEHRIISDGGIGDDSITSRGAGGYSFKRYDSRAQDEVVA